MEVLLLGLVIGCGGGAGPTTQPSCNPGDTSSCVCSTGARGRTYCVGGVWATCFSCGAGLSGEDGGGGGGSNCSRGFRRGSLGTCELDPAHPWTVTATRGELLSARRWDPEGSGRPDPYACLTLGGRETCTPVVEDTASPVWNHTFPAAPAAELLAGVPTRFADEDGAEDDPVCPTAALLRVTPAEFLAGVGEAACGDGSWSYSLRAQ